MINSSGSTNPGPWGRWDQLALMTLLWGWVRLLHQVSFQNLWLTTGDPIGIALIVMAVVAIFRPRALWVLPVLLVLSLLRTARWIPFTPNHILFEWLVDIGLLTAWVWTAYRQGLWRKASSDTAASRQALFDAMAPVGRLALPVLYLWAVVHKLNVDYFDPEVSCGRKLLEGVFTFLLRQDIDLPPWMDQVGIWGTLFFEAAIPLALLVPRLRPVGILAGIIFHVVLALHPHGGIFSFTGMLYGFFFLYTGDGFARQASELWGRITGHLSHWGYHLLVLCVIAVLAGTGTLFGAYEQQNLEQGPGMTSTSGFLEGGAWFGAGYFVFLGLSALVLYLYVRTLRAVPDSVLEPVSYRPRPALLLVIPALVFLNGLMPYLGLKTQTAFSMFSNLRTEGGRNNHLFLPGNMLTSRYQMDLVRITATDHPRIRHWQAQGMWITHFELRRMVARQPGAFFVEYEHEGSLHRYTQTGPKNTSDPELSRPMGAFEGRVLRFRPIWEGPCPCQH